MQNTNTNVNQSNQLEDVMETIYTYPETQTHFDSIKNVFLLQEELYQSIRDDDKQKTEELREAFDKHLDALSHEYLDKVYLSMLWHFAKCGSNQWKPSRGMLNSMVIQCFSLDVMGGDLGATPEWNIDDTWMRIQLLRHVDGSNFFEETDTDYNALPLLNLSINYRRNIMDTQYTYDPEWDAQPLVERPCPCGESVMIKQDEPSDDGNHDIYNCFKCSHMAVVLNPERFKEL